MLFRSFDQRALAFAAGALALLVIALVSRRRLPATALFVAVGLYAARFAQGLGFVPGTLAASPAGTTARPHTAGARVLVVGAVAAAPVVWMLQWQGQLVPQWGGRYLLLTGALLLIVASVEWRSVVPAIALTVAVSGFGAAWHVDRTKNVARAVASLEAVAPGTVIVSGVTHLGREAGAWYEHRRWLTAIDGDEHSLEGAIERSEERRVGKECRTVCRSRWSPYH